MKHFIFAGAIILGAVGWGSVRVEEPNPARVTQESLLEEMTDLSRLARPAPAVTRLLQFSSYDRNSRIENNEKKKWFANRDIGNYLRKEQTSRGTEWVMAEFTGPGAIVRMWSANAGRRIWRVYLEGREKPVIEAKGNHLLDGLKGGLPSAFSHQRNFGYNLYLPIPFQNGCKVTVSFPDGGDRDLAPLMYYHVDLRAFPPGTQVETFSWEGLKNLTQKIQTTASLLLNPQTRLPAGAASQSLNPSLEPGQSASLALADGPAAIREIIISVKTDSDLALKQALGRTLLEINFDQSARPQVSSPLGEFFGAGPGVAPFNSLPLAVEKTGTGLKLTCRWVMPFQREAKITLTNFTDSTVDYEVKLATGKWDEPADSLYFHAGFRSRDLIPTRPPSDLTLLSAAGPGRYVGTELNVRNHLEHFWWGEGDEKIYVDRESFPSIFGTGTEDYFGYAWCVQYFRFAHAYHGVPGPARVLLFIPQSMLYFPWPWVAVSHLRPGFDTTSQYRWHILDDIPFSQSIQFDLEILHHRKTVVDVAAVTYWYSAPGATDDLPEFNLKNRKVW